VLLEVVEDCWRLLNTAGGCWDCWLLVVGGCSMLWLLRLSVIIGWLLGTVGGYSRLIEVAKSCWRVHVESCLKLCVVVGG